MKVVAKDGKTLTLRSAPWVLGLLLAAILLIFAGIGLNALLTGNDHDAQAMGLLLLMFGAAFAIFVRQDVAVFDREADRITLSSATVFRRSRVERPLSTYRGVEIEETDDSTGDSNSRKRLRRAVLVFKDGERLPLTPVFSTSDGAETAQKAIRAFMGKRK